MSDASKIQHYRRIVSGRALPTIDVLFIAYRERYIADAVRQWLAFDFVTRVVVVLGAVRGVEPLGLPPTDPDAVLALDAIDDERVHVITRATYWSDKNAMTVEGTAACSADLVWHVDADEYYLPADVIAAREALADDGWELAGFPHAIFWRDFEHVLATADGRVGWVLQPRIWRRRDGECFLHMPGAVQRQDGTIEHVRLRVLDGWCHHAAWIDDERVKFRIDYYHARGTLPGAYDWHRRVWVGGETPSSGVHPAVPGLFPVMWCEPKPAILGVQLGVLPRSAVA